MKRENKRVSVHITSKDRSSELAILLHSLLNQTYKAFDICLLDDAFGTPIASNFKFIHDILNRLKLRGHGVQLIRNNISLGVCRARQQLVDEDIWKENPYILRLDDDQILEPDYIQRLVTVIEKNPKCGIASGVTPLFSGPDFRRDINNVVPIVNKIELDSNGSISLYNDDCGFLYDGNVVLPADQFRSSALIRRELFDKGLTYPKGLSNTGFREEAYLSLRTILLGWRLYIDLGAIAWHAPAMSGGCRSGDYAARVQIDQNSFERYLKYQFKEHGDFIKKYNEEVLTI